MWSARSYHILLALAIPAGLAAGDRTLAVDRVRIDEGEALRALAAEERGGLRTLTSPGIEIELPFNEALISWNVEAAGGTGFAVAMRFGREGAGAWSAWYHLGRFGAHPAVTDAVVEDAGGKVDVDWFLARGQYRAYQYRFSLRGKERPPTVRRVSVVASNTTGDRGLFERHGRRPLAPAAGAGPLRLDVPFRSQTWESKEIAGRICSPTSVAMVLAFHGIDRPTAEVAARAHDPDHDIYGNWPANVQAAFSYGCAGRLARFRSWEEARAQIEAGQPIVISIRDPEGVLKGTPYGKTDGHLLVLTGFDGKGNPRVNDPAAPDRERGVTTYDRAQMEKVWLDRGGLGYLIEGRKKP